MNASLTENDTGLYKAESYRWVILVVFMFVALMTQVVWITFAPIMSNVATDYSVPQDSILLLTASYMVVYILVNFPATWLLDKYGLKWGTGIGVILLGVFGLLRAFVGTDYNLLFIAQVLTAIGQPFILNSFTKVAVNWFPENEKTLATGLGTISILLGVIIGMIATPFIYESSGINSVLLIYGLFCFISMVLYFAFTKNSPSSPPNKFAGQKAFNYDGLKTLFSNKNFDILLVLLFIGLGAFNAILSEVDVIFAIIRVPVEASGLIGGTLIIGGIIGAGILSSLSDKTNKRVIFLQIAMIVGTILTVLLVLFSDFTTVALIAFVFGFFLVAGLPVGLIYATEITFPVTEEASNGLLFTAGQLSGLLFILLFDLPVQEAMYILAFLFLVGSVLSLLLKDKKPESS